MESSFVEWAFLEKIVGNFTDLYQYYFAYSSYLAAPFRTAAVSIVYSFGLAFAALCFLKAPVDRLRFWYCCYWGHSACRVSSQFNDQH